MSQRRRFYQAAFAVICMVSMLISIFYKPYEAAASTGYEFVILSQYEKTMKIGDSFYLAAVTTNGKTPKFSSSNSAVASVNTYGKVTAKKAGSAEITAKTTNGEASCKVTVKKTTIVLSQQSLALENGASARLTVKTSTGHTVKWKSSKTSIASVDENGVVLAKKPGAAVVTATVDKNSAECKVTVKSPKVKLSRTSVSLYRKGTVKLSVSTTSKSMPKWKTNKKSVATVDENGQVTAIKNGTAIITVTVDDVSKSCEVTVKKPTVRFSTQSIELCVGEQYKSQVKVSSGNKPTFSSSNTSVAEVSENGVITARTAGKAYIYASEDGAKDKMTVIVKDTSK